MIEHLKNTVLKVYKLWLLFATIFVSNLFLVYTPEGMVTFILSGFSVPKNTAIYMTYEHAGLIIIAWLLCYPPSEQRYMYKLFLILTVMDMFFFMLYYKSPALWNPLRCVIFGVPLIHETWKAYRQS